MSTEQDREQAIERLLKQTLSREVLPVSADECLDAETFAAWADGALLAHELAAAEHHTAGCARCQAVRASMAQIDPRVSVAAPAAGVPARPDRPAVSWRTWSLRWLVPIGAMATALAIWVAVPRNRATPNLAPAETAPSVPPDVSAPPEAAAGPAPAVPPAQGSAQLDERRRAADKPQANAADAKEAVAPPPTAAPTETLATAKVAQPDQGRRDQQELDAAARSAPAPAPSAQARREENVTVTGAAPVVDSQSAARVPRPAASPSPAPPNAPAPAAPAGAQASGFQAPPVATADRDALPRAAPGVVGGVVSAPPAAAQGGGGRGGAGAGRGAGRGGAPASAGAARQSIAAPASGSGSGVGPGALSLVVVSPNPAVRWRTSQRTLETSADGGATWQPMPFGGDPALIQSVVAGAAPSATVCWLVGRSGTILLVADGAVRQVLFPEQVALTGVQARNASEATVTAADGRRFATSDGGRGWRPVR